jgi:hypothetical protein
MRIKIEQTLVLRLATLAPDEGSGSRMGSGKACVSGEGNGVDDEKA